jgi:hypothetical protein
MMLDEKALTKLTEQLNQSCLNFIKENAYEQALLIWRALLKGAQLQLLPDAAIAFFLLETTRALQAIIPPNELLYVFQITEQLLQRETDKKVNSLLYRVLEELRQIHRDTHLPSFQSASKKRDFRTELDTLRYATSSYQEICHASNASPDDIAKAETRITQHETKFLHNYYLEAWQIYQQIIDQNFKDPLTAEDYSPALYWLAQMIELNKSRQHPSKPRLVWLHYRQRLNGLRQKLYAAIPTLPLLQVSEIEQTKKAQCEFNKQYRDFLAELIADCEAILGKAPFAYALLGVGSISHNGALQFSDLEYIIVTQPNLNTQQQRLMQAYLVALIQLFEFKIQMLGESNENGNIKGLLIDHGVGISPMLAGIHLEGMAGTVEDIFKIIKLLQPEDTAIYSLLNPVYIYGNSCNSILENPWSGARLFKDYQAKIQAYLNTPHMVMAHTHASLPPHAQHATYWLAYHHEQLTTELNTELTLDALIDLKERYIGHLSRIALDFAYYYQLPIANTVDRVTHLFEIWEALSDKLDAGFIKAVKQLLAAVTVLRIKLQHHYQQQLKPEYATFSVKAAKSMLEDQQNDMKGQLKKVFPNPSIKNIAIIENTQGIANYKSNRPTKINNKIYMQLEAHEWLVMRPLSLALQKCDLTKPLALKIFNPLQDVFSHLIKQTDTPFCSITQHELIKYLVNYLKYMQASTDSYFTYYQYLLQADLENPENAQLEFVLALAKQNELSPSERLTAIITTLQYKANPDGWCPLREMTRQKWYQSIKLLVQPIEDIKKAYREKQTIIETRNLDDPLSTACHQYLLTAKAYQALFNEMGEFRSKPEGQDGRHTVLPITLFDPIGRCERTFYCKIAPEQPATETLDDELSWLLTGEGHPCTLVWKIMRWSQSKQCYCTDIIQVSEAVKGMNLSAQNMLTHPERLSAIDKASFTRQLLNVVITNPEDDKGEDYFLEPLSETSHDTHTASTRYRLRRLDRERKFFQPDETQKTYIMLSSKKVLLVKTLIYCLNQMFEPLDTGVLKRFAQLNAEAVLSRWLKFAENEMLFYQHLFPNAKEVEAHFKREGLGFSLLAVFIPAGFVRDACNRMEAIQDLIKFSSECESENNEVADTLALTGLQILEKVQSVLYKYYRPTFNSYPVDLQHPEWAEQRFESITKTKENDLYSLSAEGKRQTKTPGILALTKNSNSIKQRKDPCLDVLGIYQGQVESVYSAQAELEAIVKVNVIQLVQDILSNTNNIYPQIELLSGTRQTLLIRHLLECAAQIQTPSFLTANNDSLVRILEIMAHGFTFSNLDFRFFQTVLTDKLLLPILKTNGKSLTSLNLSYCILLTEKSLDAIEQYCPTLKELNLAHMTQLKSIEQLKLKHLIHFDLSGCSQLVKVNTYLPRLAKLETEKCFSLNQIILKARILPAMNIKGCVQLQTIDNINVLKWQKLAENEEKYLQPISLIKETVEQILDVIIKREPNFKWSIELIDNSLALKLCDSTLLTNDILILILNNIPSTIAYLHLDKCSTLSDDVLAYIAKECTSLKELLLNSINFNYFSFEKSSPSFFSYSNFFPKLSKLTIINCPHLKTIDIKTQKLATFHTENCNKLTYLNINSSKLTNISAINCKKILEINSNSPIIKSINLEKCDVLANLLAKSNSLIQLRIRNCPLLKFQNIMSLLSINLEELDCDNDILPINLNLIKKYPFLLTYPADKIDPKLLSCINNIDAEKRDFFFKWMQLGGTIEWKNNKKPSNYVFSTTSGNEIIKHFRLRMNYSQDSSLVLEETKIGPHQFTKFETKLPAIKEDKPLMRKTNPDSYKRYQAELNILLLSLIKQIDPTIVKLSDVDLKRKIKAKIETIRGTYIDLVNDFDMLLQKSSFEKDRYIINIINKKLTYEQYLKAQDLAFCFVSLSKSGELAIHHDLENELQSAWLATELHIYQNLGSLKDCYVKAPYADHTGVYYDIAREVQKYRIQEMQENELSIEEKPLYDMRKYRYNTIC